MIIVKLSDGLGNQMFQYALGRRLSLLNDTELKLDLSWFERRDQFGGTDRTVTLDGFDVRFEPATEADVRSVTGSRVATALFKRYGRFLEYAPHTPARHFNYYREIRGPPDGSARTWAYRRRYYPGMLEIRGDAYLDGYWQAPAYFEDIRDVILDDFSVSDPPVGKNAEVADQIAETRSVGVHVRRGDQVDQGPAWSTQGNAIPATYYRQAAERIVDTVGESRFFVFSDDPGWCERHLSLGFPTTFVTHNDGSTDYEDVRLLRRCDHQIISNSTFSWWGAWLNENEEKVVIAPTPWKKFGFPDGIVEEWELLPEEWDVLDYV